LGGTSGFYAGPGNSIPGKRKTKIPKIIQVVKFSLKIFFLKIKIRQKFFFQKFSALKKIWPQKNPALKISVSKISGQKKSEREKTGPEGFLWQKYPKPRFPVELLR